MTWLNGDELRGIDRRTEEFEAAWQRGTPSLIEELLRGEADPRARAELLRYALAVELEYRRRLGEAPVAGEYERRFPDHVDVVRVAFTEQSTVTVPRGSTVEADTFIPPWPGSERIANPTHLGKFEVMTRLGGGGQGLAFLTRDPELGQLVVLKRYHAAGDDAAREARNLCRVRSPYTAQCRDLMRHGGELYLIMEYIPGRSLSEILKEGRPTPEVAVRLAEQVAEGLEAVHACGLIHRDIKPSNVVVGDDGVARLVDFGLAAHLGSIELDSLSGTPPYMSPEQARGHGSRIDARTDLYGLGGVLYAMLTGRPPHPGKDPKEALEHARQGLVAPPRSLNRSISPALERIVMKALAADPALRYASAADLRRSLRRYRNRHWVRAAAGLGSIVMLVMLALAVSSHLRPVPIPAAASPVALKGELIVRVFSPGGGGKQGVRVEDPGALPVVPGQWVRLEVRLNRPAYAYLAWINGKGQVVSLYPWTDRKFRSRPSRESSEISVDSPPEVDKGWPVRGPGGLETALLLVRSTPLPADRNLAAMIGPLPPSPLRDPQEAAVRGFDASGPIAVIERGVTRSLGEESARIDDPLLQMMERLRPDFEIRSFVRFAYRGE